MRSLELVFIPSPCAGHMLSTVEFAKHLVNHDQRISITILVMKIPNDSKQFSPHDVVDESDLIKSIHLLDPGIDFSEIPIYDFFPALVESYKPQIKEVVTNIVYNQSAASGDDHVTQPKLAAFVIDMFCTSMIDLANEFGLPTYMFYTSGALFLSIMLHLQEIHDEQIIDVTQLKDSEIELEIPSLVNPLPESIFNVYRGIRRVKGILVNTFLELEPYAWQCLTSLSDGNTLPTVYHVGPILNLEVGSSSKKTNSEIMTWLDDQPPSSVIFLCFGSMGSFEEAQVREIATALERSGQRFLWSQRKPPPEEEFTVSEEYENLADVLPKGFLDRTTGFGKIIGWAPQTAVLGHQEIGGFVSHCGWNSIQESIWFGVPVATWPLFADQHTNAFMLVKEGLAVEIKMDYQRNMNVGSEEEVVVSAAMIERGIRLVMAEESEVRKEVKEMSEKSRKALDADGSSFISLRQFIQDLTDNVALPPLGLTVN